MKVYVPRILTGLVACMLTMQTAWAQPNSAPPQNPDGTILAEPMQSAPLINDAPGSAVVQNYFGYTEVDKTFDPLIRVDTRGGTLYGQGGFTRISFFEPYWIDNSALVFVDLGGYATYNPSGGANVGAGWRYYMEDLDRIIGINGWYDFDNGNHRAYHQFGIGFESLGRYIDYRVNGYIPFGDTHNTLNSSISGTPSFINNFIFLNRFINQETAFKGFDAEMGGPMPFIGRYGVNAYVGGYFFVGRQVGNVTGISARVQGQVNEDVTIGAQVTHDSVFDTNAQVQVTLTLPDGSPSRWLRQPKVRDRMLSQVIRNYRVVAHDETVAVSEVAINPNDNRPYFVAHVDPNRTPGTGNGTFENPFSQISQFDNLALGAKSQYGIIYVRPRTDNTSTQLDTGVTLLSNQHLWSTSISHTIDVIAQQTNSSGVTTYDIPGSVSGPLPVLSNTTGGNVVTFTTGAQNIEVSGFTINGSATGNGIFGIDNRGVNINRNTIQNSANGVLLENLSGTSATNQVSIIDRNNFLGNLGEGLFVDNNAAAPLEIVITRNTATGNQGNAFALSSANGSNIGGVISGNSTVTGSTLFPNLNSGLALFADNGTIDFYDLTKGWSIGGTDTGTDTNPFNDANNFSDNGNFGVNVVSTNNSTVSVRFVNNEISRNSLNGLGFLADSGTSFIAIGGATADEGNRFANNGLNGILVDLSGTALAGLNIQHNTLTSNGANGAGGGTGGGGGVSLYNIDVVFNGGLTASQQAIFALAAAKWESIITGDVPNINGIDDIQIGAEGAAIDGTGGILGQAGPTALRPTSFLPYLGQMQFDTADLAALEAAGQLDDVILHEMGHVLGFGTIWSNLGLLTGAGSSDPRFTGANATREYDAKFGVTDTSVPVENTGGSGTADAHWRESVFTNELMTGFLNSGVANPISRTTVGQFQDLGYQVNYNSADPYARTGLNAVTVPLGQINRPNAVVSGSVTPAVHTNLISAGAPIGDGINISVGGSATLSPSNISDNTVTQSARHGLFVHTSGTGSVPDLEIRNNTFSNNGTGTVGSGIFLEKTENSTLNVTLDGNTINQNLGDGVSVNVIGSGVPVVINSFDNKYSGNTGNGLNLHTNESGVLNFNSSRDQTNNNTLNGVNIEADDDSTVNANFFNLISTGNTQNGIRLETDGNGQINLHLDSPTDPLFTGTGTTLNNNLNGLFGVAGGLGGINILIERTDTTQGLVTDISHNTQDGINLLRKDGTLLLTTILDTNISNNGSDGIQLTTSGAYPADPNIPNRLNLLRTTVNNNGANGLNISTLGDSMLVVHATTSTFNNNGADGIRVFSGDASIFGNDTTNEYSSFDNVSLVGNGGDGMHLFAMGNNSNKSLMLVDVNSDSGTTRITDNADDGIGASAPYGTIKLQVRGTSLYTGNQMLIQRNGDNGIEFNVANLAQDGLDNQIYVEHFPPSGLPAPPNFDVLFTSVGLFNGVGVLTVQNVTIGDDNSIHGTLNGNGGDGIHLFNSNGEDFRSAAGSVPGGPSISTLTGRAGSLDVTIDNSIIASNVDNGINFLSQGLYGTFDTGNVNNVTVTNSHIAYNGDSGVTMLLNGKNGEYDTDFSTEYTRTELNQFVFDNNLIEANHNYGIYYESNAAQMFRPGGLFWLDLFADPAVVPGTAVVYNPNAIGNTGGLSGIYNAGFNADLLYALDNYMSIATDVNASLTLTNNTIRFNGSSSTTTGDGVYIRVSTDSYLAADIGGEAGSGNGNVFAGNAGADIKFGSFVAYNRGDASRTPLQPPQSIPGDDTNGVPDRIWFDDTAQLDLRFNNNTGHKLDAPFQIVVGGGNAGLTAAAYDNNDPNKNGAPRLTQLFQLDDATNVDNNNLGWNQTLGLFPLLFDQFRAGNFHMRNTGPDPLFPNSDFPFNWVESPGDPFLP